MENGTQNQNQMHGKTCNCADCQAGRMGFWSMHRHHIIGRMIFMLVVILFTFWLGFQLGEMKGFLVSGGFGGMRTTRMMPMQAWNGGTAVPVTMPNAQ